MPRQSAVKSIPMNVMIPLNFVTTSLASAHLNVPYDARILISTSADPTSWTVVSGTLPPGMQLSNPTQTQVEISGTPTQAGSFPITLQVQDNNSPPQVSKQALTLVVDTALTITTQNLSPALVNSAYSAALTVVNGIPPLNWSAIGLPAGLTIDASSGTVSGIPSANGIYQPTVTVADSAGHSTSQNLGLTVLAILQINTSQSLIAAVNRPYNGYLYVFGGSPPYNWSIVSGSLPSGLSLDAQRGAISGTPTQLGTTNVTFQVTDTGPPQQAAQWATTFSVTPPQLALTGTLPTKLPVGESVQWSPAALGGTPPYHWSAATGTLPPGLSFDPSMVELSGTPTTAGQYTFTLQVSDSASPAQTATRNFTANVTTPLGRNDAIANATPIGDGSWQASLSPYADPPDNPTPTPDTDYYKIIGSGGSVVKIWTASQNFISNVAIDPVMEIVDSNGVRLNTCRQPGDTSTNFNSNCLNDDIVQGVNRDSQLEITVPGPAKINTSFYAHVLDWRGDGRPDMTYTLNVAGSIAPLQAQPPSETTYGGGYWSPSGCAIAQACKAQFTATGGTTPYSWRLASGTIPGMTLDPSTGLLSGTPSATGAYTAVAQVADAAIPAQTSQATFVLTVGTPPVVLTTSLPNATTGQPYTFALSESGGTPPLNWWVQQGDYLLNLQIDPHSGVLTGLARTPNVDNIIVFLSDALGLQGVANLTLTIKAGPLVFPNGSFPNAKVGLFYSDSTPNGAIAGGAAPFTYALAAGTVPPGLGFQTSGGLYGTPTAPGTYSMVILATDSSTPAQTATATYTITINP
jgi:hypothetical protein